MIRVWSVRFLSVVRIMTSQNRVLRAEYCVLSAKQGALHLRIAAQADSDWTPFPYNRLSLGIQ